MRSAIVAMLLSIVARLSAIEAKLSAIDANWTIGAGGNSCGGGV
jgi:hypothetical protein